MHNLYSILFAACILCFLLLGCDNHPVSVTEPSFTIPEQPKRVVPLAVSAPSPSPTPVSIPEPTKPVAVLIPPVSEHEIQKDLYERKVKEFKRMHGTEFDPLSKKDREKFEKIKVVDLSLPVDFVQEPSVPVVVALPTPAPTPPLPSESIVRNALVEEAKKYLGIREEQGNNRSSKLDKINLRAGSYIGAPWCASVLYDISANVGEQLGIKSPYPKTARAVVMGKQFHIGNRTMLPGDTFYVGSYSHTGMIEEWGNIGMSTITLEGNTSPSAATPGQERDGDGFYRKKRLKASLQYGADWVTDRIQPKTNK